MPRRHRRTSRIARVDFLELTKRVSPVESLQPNNSPQKRKMILTNCAACAAPLAHTAPRCVRCHTRYCNSACQHDHWRQGRDDARGRGTDCAARARTFAPEHRRHCAQFAKGASRPRRPRRRGSPGWSDASVRETSYNKSATRTAPATATPRRAAALQGMSTSC